MTPPLHDLRRMLAHVETAANELRKAVQEHDTSAVDRVRQCWEAMQR